MLGWTAGMLLNTSSSIKDAACKFLFSWDMRVKSYAISAVQNTRLPGDDCNSYPRFQCLHNQCTRKPIPSKLCLEALSLSLSPHSHTHTHTQPNQLGINLASEKLMILLTLTQRQRGYVLCILLLQPQSLWNYLYAFCVHEQVRWLYEARAKLRCDDDCKKKKKTFKSVWVSGQFSNIDM